MVGGTEWANVKCRCKISSSSYGDRKRIEFMKTYLIGGKILWFMRKRELKTERNILKIN